VGGKRRSTPERGHGHLDVDHILGGQTGHGGRADVVHAQREVAQRGAQRQPEAPELSRPARVGRGDDDAIRHGRP
jgi:hypothetical protein